MVGAMQGDRAGQWGAVVTQGVDDYHRGDHFHLTRLAFELHFQNIPDGVRLNVCVPEGVAAGRVILGTLHLSDGRFMAPKKNGTWEWRRIAR